jgi:hypothetical protein
MIAYQYAVRDEINRVVSYAAAVRAKFSSGAEATDLLRDAEHLATLYASLINVLPKEISKKIGKEGKAPQHLHWMRKFLREGKVDRAEVDILDICRIDLPAVEHAFRDWIEHATEYDGELREKTTPLLIQREFDSAIRKAFVILTSRLRATYNLPNARDGAKLANAIFGSDGAAAATLDASQRAAMRDFVAGLYGVYRNRYGHEDVEAPLHEAESVIGSVNWLLLWLSENGPK